jgi:hypothetical protein
MRIDETKVIQDARVSIAGAADGLVITSLITTADELLRVAVASEQTAVAAMAKAESDLVAAKLASDKAAHQPGSDMMTAELALEQAERLERVSAKVLKGATHNRKVAAEALAHARGEAYHPVAVEGAKRMIDACRKVEEARALLNASFVEFRAGELLMHTARQNGTQVRGPGAGENTHRWIIDGNGEPCLSSSDAELKTWVAAGLLDAPVEG